MSYIGRQLNIPASTVQLTAEGAITAGKPCIVEVDGDVAQVKETEITQSIGSTVTFETGALHVSPFGIAYDKNAQRVVIAYKDTGNSGYGTAVVGTVSGTSISFGTPVVFNSANTGYSGATYDENAQKTIISYSNVTDSDKATARVGTVSGTSISFGTATAMATAWSTYIKGLYDPDSQKLVFGWRNESNGDGQSAVGTVSGTSISFGSVATFDSGSVTDVALGYDTGNQKVVVAYRDSSGSSDGKAVVGTVSGTSISFGSSTTFSTGNAQQMNTVGYDPNSGKVLIAYKDGDVSNYGHGIVGTVSGTSISFGTATVFESANSNDINAIYHTAAEKIVVQYTDQGNSNSVTSTFATISGTSVSFSTPIAIAGPQYSGGNVAYDSDNNQLVASYRDGANGDIGKSNVYRLAYTEKNLTSENFIGFAENDCTDNGLATIQLGGSINDKQTSLTAGQTYFVQTDGTIGTTADSPSVTAGTAVSATQILVKG
jgi:hypothetical protein